MAFERQGSRSNGPFQRYIKTGLSCKGVMDMRGRLSEERFRQKLNGMVQQLKNELMEGRYAIGEYLPSEKALSKRFGLGNLSVRRGLEMLADEGWIEKIPSVGNRVAANRAKLVIRLGCNATTIRNAALPLLLSDFNQLYPWIEVSIHIFTSETLEQSIQCNTGDSQLDAALISGMDFERMGLSGRSAFVQRLPFGDRVYPFLHRMFSVEGELLLRPILFSPVVLCYNRTHFRQKKLGEPTGDWTWDDLVHHAELLTEGERYGFCCHLPNVNRWPLFLLQGAAGLPCRGNDGNDVSESSADSGEDLKPLLEGLRLTKRIMHNQKAFPRYMSENNEDISRLFREGRLSMVLTSYFAMNAWKDASLDFDVAPLPYITEPRTLVLSIGAGVLRTSSRQEEAGALVDYLGSERAQRLLRTCTYSIPALQTEAEAEIEMEASEASIRQPSRYGMYRETMFAYRTHTDLPIATEALAPMTRTLKAYWADLISERELSERLLRAVRESR